MVLSIVVMESRLALAEKVENFINTNGFNIRLDYGAFSDRPYDSPEVWETIQKSEYFS